MTRSDWISGFIRLGLLALVFAFGAWVEPCDGHSCKGEQHERQ